MRLGDRNQETVPLMAAVRGLKKRSKKGRCAPPKGPACHPKAATNAHESTPASRRPAGGRFALDWVAGIVGLRKSRLRHRGFCREFPVLSGLASRAPRGPKDSGCRHFVAGQFSGQSWSPTAGEDLEMAILMFCWQGRLVVFLGATTG